MKQFIKYGLIFKSVEIEDAEFILELRTNTQLARYLHETKSNLILQQDWIKSYKERESKKQEFYFIVMKDTEKLGMVRIYGMKDNTFEIGSWLFKKGVDISYPILADIAIKEYGIENIQNTEGITFEVRIDNKQVVKYHKRYDPELVGEDELNLYFYLPVDNFVNNKSKILKLLNQQ